jgi:hypothetical protein
MCASLSANFDEKFYTVHETAKLLRKSPSWVYREFRDYIGVIRSGKPKPGKRPYVTRLIPESVLRRWIREHSAPERAEEIPFHINHVVT